MKLAESRLDADLGLAEESFNEAQAKMTQEYQLALEEAVKNYQEQIANKEEELAEKTLALTELKTKVTAGIEAAKRQEELESKIDYYRIQIPEEDKNEIEAILSIKHLIRNQRVLLMLIWSNYYSKRVNELAVRVLGSTDICGIYRITNIITQQSYIGQSQNIRERWREHCKFSLGIDTPGQNKLYTNTMKYGIENFTFELLEKCPVIELDQKEKFWISFYDTYNNGLNSNRGNKEKIK